MSDLNLIKRFVVDADDEDDSYELSNVQAISVNPLNINWEKEDVILYNASTDTYITKKDEIINAEEDGKLPTEFAKKLSKHFIIVNQNVYGAVGTEITIKDNYISLRQFKDMDCLCYYYKNNYSGYRSTIFKSAKQIFYPTILDCFYSNDNLNDRRDLKIEQQIRIYKNRRCSVVYKMTWKDGSSSFFVYNKPIRERRRTQVLYFSSNRQDSSYGMSKFLQEGFQLVYNDQEIEKLSVPMNNGLGLSTCIYLDSSLFTEESAIVNKTNSYEMGPSFSTELTKQINDFFEYNSEENSLLKSSFDSSYNTINYTSRDKSKGIYNLDILSVYLSINMSSVRAKNTKQSFAEAIWPTIQWGDDRSVTWERRDNLIICAYKVDSRYKHAFIYNVDSKIRTVLNCSDYADNVETLTPSLNNCIMKYFDALSYNDPSEYSKRPIPQTRIDGKTFREIFDGTNMAWIMDNMSLLDDDFKIVIPQLGKNNTKKITDEINADKMGSAAVCVLATTGDPLLEQLLKTKQFNIYFSELYSIAESRGYFRDLNKQYAYDAYSGVGFFGKEKSLKKMFKMTMPQIQALSKSIYIDYGTYYNSYGVPDLYKVFEALNINSFTDIDINSFQKILDISTKASGGRHRYCYNSNCWQKISSSKPILDILNPMSPKEKIDFIYKLGGSNMGVTYEDYLKMRSKMEVLQESRPDEEIFQKEDYPLRVGSANIFIRFTPGMRNPQYCADEYVYYSRERINTDEEFQEYIKQRYELGTGEKDIKFVTNSEGGISGARVKMNPCGYLNYLHDEMGRWFALYNDPAQAAAFQKALDRVKPLEWEDDKGPLCIIYPRDPSAVKNEGKILSHCVASYVDPIIEGTENIMFIRRKDMKGEPFFTVDITPKGELRQVHCYRNGNVSQSDIDHCYSETKREVYNIQVDIIEFLKRWAKAMNGKIDAKSIKDHYGALCAAR